MADGGGSVTSRRLPKGPEAPSFFPGARLPFGDDLQAIRNLGYSWGSPITAHSGGGFGHATGIIYTITTIGTCAADGDSVKLPQTIPGLNLLIKNDTGHAAQIFAYLAADTIDGVPGDTGISLGAGEKLFFQCADDGDWFSSGTIGTSLTFTGDVTGSGTGTIGLSITDGAVTLAKMAEIDSQTILGRTSAGTADVEDLTANQAGQVVGRFATRTAAAAASIASSITAIETGGYATAGLGAARYIHAVGTTAGGFQSADGQWWKLATQTLDAFMFGALGDDVDDTAAMAAALSTGLPILLHKPSSAYRVTTTLTVPAGSMLYGDGAMPTVKLVSGAIGTLFSLNSGTVLKGLTLDGSGGASADRFIDGSGCIGVTLDTLHIVDPLSTLGIVVLTRDGCLVQNCWFDNTLTDGSCVFLSNGLCFNNRILSNVFEWPDTAHGGFGVDFFPGSSGSPSKNIVEGNAKFNGISELAGVRSNAQYNRIHNNYYEGGGDTGISLSGQFNSCVGNVIKNMTGAGITIWGSHNTIVGNVCVNNGQGGILTPGILILPAFGGTGQFNVVSGNHFDDTQTPRTQACGVQMVTGGAQAWVTGTASTVYTAAPNYGFCYNGLNTYRYISGATTGATPPTHTSGQQSDGGVIWRYEQTFTTTVNKSWYNFIGINSSGKQSGVPLYVDADNFLHNYIPYQVDSSTGVAIPSWVVGGGLRATWTSASQLTVRGSGDAGIACEIGATSLFRLGVAKSADGAVDGAWEYDRNAQVISEYTAGAKRWNTSAAGDKSPQVDATQALGSATRRMSTVFSQRLDITDGIAAPSATVGYAKIFVDVADGDLKIIFGDGTTKTIVTDT